MIVLNKAVDKIATAGLFITAFFSSCCFPLYGFILSTLGLGSVELFGGFTWYFFIAMVLLSLFGQYWSYRKHKNILPLSIALLSATIILTSYYFLFSIGIIYSGMFGLLIATILNHFAKRKTRSCPNCAPISTKKIIVFQSTISCPNCGYSKKEIMPHDTCEFFYECENCKTVLKPRQGDCCVYCSYGTVKCPPIQVGSGCC